MPSLRPVLRAPSGEHSKPGGRGSRQNSNRHSCNDRSARALRPSPPDAARTTSSAAKTAANQRELREKNGRHRRGPPPRGAAQLAQGPPHRLRRAAAEQGRRVDGPAELGRRHPGQEGHDVRVSASAVPSHTRIGSCLDVLSARRRPRTAHARRATHRHAIAATHPDDDATRVQVGGLRVQPHDGVLERLPRHRTNRQVRVAAGPVPVSAFTRRRRRDASSTPSPRRLLEISHTQARSSGT